MRYPSVAVMVTLRTDAAMMLELHLTRPEAAGFVEMIAADRAQERGFALQ